MADVFISHAAADSHLAEFLHRHLTQEGLSVYLASVSMPPGERWMPHIMDQLRGSGEVTGGPKPFGPRDRSEFLGALDRAINRIKRGVPPGR